MTISSKEEETYKEGPMRSVLLLVFGSTLIFASVIFDDIEGLEGWKD